MHNVITISDRRLEERLERVNPSWEWELMNEVLILRNLLRDVVETGSSQSISNAKAAMMARPKYNVNMNR